MKDAGENRSSPPKVPTRREVLAALAGASCTAALGLSGCVTTNPAREYSLAFTAGEGMLDLARVPELAQTGGSIKGRTEDGTPILIWRALDGTFGAAAITCTHRGCEVTFNAPEGRLDCPCHGSRYALDGEVLAGPARRPLRSFPATHDPATNSLTIRFPGT
jgi:Rieske Fe-S protein